MYQIVDLQYNYKQRNPCVLFIMQFNYKRYQSDNCCTVKLFAATFTCFLSRFNDKSLCSVRANIVIQSDRLEWDRMEYDNTSDRVGVEDRFKRSYSTGKVQPSLIQRQVIRQLTRLIAGGQPSFSPFYNNICFSFLKLIAILSILN